MNIHPSEIALYISMGFDLFVLIKVIFDEWRTKNG